MASLKCPEHPNGVLIEDYRAGDMICRECGLVVGDRVIDVTSEWRTFANDSDAKDRSRVGDVQNSLLSGSDLSTRIGVELKPGNHGMTDYQAGIKKRGAQNTSNNAADKYLMNGFREIAIQCDRASLPDSIVSRAKLRFKNVYEAKCLRNRSVAAISAACIFIACREEGVERSFKEVVSISRVPKKEIGRCFKIIISNLPELAGAKNKSNDVVTPTAFMDRFCSRLGVSRTTSMCAINIADQVRKLDLAAGKNPLTITAAAIFMASMASPKEDHRKLSEICDTCGIAESTVKNTYKLIAPRSRELFLPNFKLNVSHEQLSLMC